MEHYLLAALPQQSKHISPGISLQQGNILIRVLGGNARNTRKTTLLLVPKGAARRAQKPMAEQMRWTVVGALCSLEQAEYSKVDNLHRQSTKTTIHIYQGGDIDIKEENK